MKFRFRFGLALVLFAWQAFTAGGQPAASSATTPGNQDRIVVMISLDGLAAYYLDDPKAEMPTLRALAAEGARATMMKVSTPSVTWPNHTTLVTGVSPARHGVAGNNYLDRATAKHVKLITDPVYDKDEIVKVPTLYDLAKGAGLVTAALRWPATRNAHTLDWTVPDVASAQLLEKYSTPALLAECRQDGISTGGAGGGSDDANAAAPSSDDEWTRMFNLLLQRHHPNLALLHLAYVDHTEHLHGPKSREAYAAVKAADRQVGMVWDELKRDFPGKASLFVVSDHGFSATKRQILPNVVLRKAGLLKTPRGSEHPPVAVVTQGGCVFIYVLDQAHYGELVGKVRKAFTGMEGIASIAGPEQYRSYGVADPKDDPHAPDLIVFAKEGYGLGDTAAGDLPFNLKPERKGSHGHDPSLPDLHATFVAWGAGIRPGVKLGEISNLAVAPTIAKLLNLNLPGAEQPALNEILR